MYIDETIAKECEESGHLMFYSSYALLYAGKILESNLPAKFILDYTNDEIYKYYKVPFEIGKL